MMALNNPRLQISVTKAHAQYWKFSMLFTLKNNISCYVAQFNDAMNYDIRFL